MPAERQQFPARNRRELVPLRAGKEMANAALRGRERTGQERKRRNEKKVEESISFMRKLALYRREHTKWKMPDSGARSERRTNSGSRLPCDFFAPEVLALSSSRQASPAGPTVCFLGIERARFSHRCKTKESFPSSAVGWFYLPRFRLICVAPTADKGKSVPRGGKQLSLDVLRENYKRRVCLQVLQAVFYWSFFV